MKAQDRDSKPNKLEKKELRKQKMNKAKKVLSKVAKSVLPTAAGLAMGTVLGPASGPLCAFITSQLSKLNISIGADKIAEIAEELVSTTAEEGAEALLTRKIKDEATIDGQKIVELLANQTDEINNINTKIKLAVQSSLRPALDGIKESMSFIREYPHETVELLAEVQDGKFQELSENFSNYIDAHFEEMTRQLKGTERQLGLKIDSISSQLSDLFELLASNSGKKLDKNSAIALCCEQLSSEVKSSRWDSPYKPDLYANRESAENTIWDFIRDINNSYGASANIFTLLAGMGIGKTWLMAYMADRLIQSGYPVLFFTLKSGGISRISRILGANSQRDAFNIICNIAAASKKSIFLFLDGLDEMPVADRPSIIQWAIDIRACMGRYNIGIFISSRQYDWESNRRINELISNNPGVFYQIGEKDGTSILMTEFSEKEMNEAAYNYGISEKLREYPKLMDYARYPFILRLFGEHCKENHNNLPDPDKIDEFMKLFYIREENSKSKTIMGRLGIRGPWLGKLGKILSCCDKNTLILHDDERIKKGVPQKDIDYVVSCGLFIREFGFIESIKINVIYSDYIRELARKFNLKFKDDSEIFSPGPDNPPPIHSDYEFAKTNILIELKGNQIQGAKKVIVDELNIARKNRDSDSLRKLSKLQIELDEYISKYDIAIKTEKEEDKIKAYILWKELSEWCENSELKELVVILNKNVKKYKTILENEFGSVRKNANNSISKGNFEETLIELNRLKELSTGGIFQEKEIHISEEIIVCENAMQFRKLRNNFDEFILEQKLSRASNALKMMREFTSKDGIKSFIPNIQNIILKMEGEYKSEQQEFELSKPKNYNGILLNGQDWQVLNEFQEMIGKKIPVVSEINWDTFGFTHEDQSVTGLGLHDNELTSLPESIGNLTALKELDLSHNKLISLPESIGYLTALKELYLYDNELTSLPESIGYLTALNVLKLYRNQLPSLPESIGDRKSLEELDLRWNKLTSLPESIGNLTALKELDLRYNKLSPLPESIGNLSSLNNLYLGSNKVTSLPESIGKLTTLEKLDLRYNKLSSLPESIGNLTALNHLDLENNNLISLPESIGNLTALNHLDLENNKLISLPESIGNLTALKKLDLSHNKLTSLPESIGDLTNLKKLYLLNNQLSSLPEIISKMTWLKVLDLGGNGLSSLPESIGNLKALEILWLHNNKLSSLPESIGNLTALERLWINHNKFFSLPVSIETWINKLKKQGCDISQ